MNLLTHCCSAACLFVLICSMCMHFAVSSLLRRESVVREDSALESMRTLQDGTWETITYDDFEVDFGSYTDGGSDADRASGSEAQYAHEGSGSLRLRDNSGQRSSAYHTIGYDVTSYSALRISFWFYLRGMENNEDFFVEYSLNNGNSWTIVKEYARGQGFSNGQFYQTSIDLTDPPYDLQTTTAKLRFRCDASRNDDRVYIDEILFQGFVPTVGTAEPSHVPSLSPSGMPSSVPSDAPSENPSQWPSDAPSADPSTIPSDLASASPSGVPSDAPSSRPSFEPSLSFAPSRFPTPVLTRDDICPLDRLNPPEKYSITPYADTIAGDDVDDDLNEISYIAFSEQTDDSGARYAYTASDKEQFSLKVLKFTNNGIGQHFHGSGTVVATYTLNLSAFNNDDWEDISLGPCTDSNVGSAYSTTDTCIYIGNFGNNARSGYVQRDVLKIFKFKEPIINNAAPQSFAVNVATIQYRYGGNFLLTYHDAETMFVDWVGIEGSSQEKKGDIYIVTKNGCDGGVGKIPVSWHKNVGAGQTKEVYDMSSVMDQPPSQGQGVSCSDEPYRQWTGGDMRRDGRLIALIRDGPPSSIYFYSRLPNESVVDALSNFPCPYVSSTSYGLSNEKKHEAVAFTDAAGTKVADISECEGTFCSPSLYLYNLDLPGSINERVEEPTIGWTRIVFDDFEGGDFLSSNYISGGSKTTVVTSTTCGGGSNSCNDCYGSKAVKISNGRGLESSFSSSADIACDSYSLLRIVFQFRFDGQDHLDTLFAEISVDGGTHYFIVGDWAGDVVDWAGGNIEYINGVCSTGKVMLSPMHLRESSFGDQVRLRFRNSANSDGDTVYVDKVTLEGYIPSDVPSHSPSSSPPAPQTVPPTLSSSPIAVPSEVPSTLTPSPIELLSREDICPLDRLNPPEKYSITPYIDIDTTDIVEDDLNEISYIVFSEQTDDSGARYAYVASDKEQFSLKVLRIADNVFGGTHFNGVGTVVANYTLNIADFSNDDWEDISLGPCTDTDIDSIYSVTDTCIYIGNFGNVNDRSGYVERDVVKIFKFKEPLLNTAAPESLTVDVATIQYRYGASFSNPIIDAETMFVDWVGVEGSSEEKMGDIYVIATGVGTNDKCDGGVGKIPVAWHKNVTAGETKEIYDMPSVMTQPPSQGQGVSCSNGPFRAWSGGDMRRDGRLIALIRDGPPASVYFYPRLGNESVVDALSNFPCPYISSTSYGLPNERKHEAVAFVDASGKKIADISECGGSCSPSLYLYNLDYPGSINERVVEPTTGWTSISFDEFEEGSMALTNYVLGGSNALLSSSQSCGGMYAVELSNGKGVASSFFSRADIACSAFSKLRITFAFRFNGYEHLDTLFAEVSVDGGSSYFIVGDWSLDVVDWAAENVSYTNGVCSKAKVVLSPIELRELSFGDQVRLRFRNSVNANNDRVYVDNVMLEGYAGDES